MRKVWRFRAQLFVACSLLQAFPNSAAGQRRWEVEDVLALKAVGQAAISPDGRWVAYVVSQNDLTESKSRSDIWLVESGGGEPVQLTRGNGTERAPAWAPDGSWLAFLSSRDGTTQVYGIRVTGGEARKVTDWKAAVTAFAISPDGNQIAFSARAEETDRDKELKKQRGRPMVWDSAYTNDWTHVWVAPLRDGLAVEPKRSSPDGLSVGAFVWSPDSRGLAWSAVGLANKESSPSRDRPTGFSREADVFVQDGPGATPRRVTSLRGGETPEAWVEGLGLLIGATGQGLGTYNRQLWLVRPEGGAAPVSLSKALDENATLVQATPNALLVEAQYRTGARLYRIALANGTPSGAPQVVSDDRLVYSGFTATRDLGKIAFSAQGPTTPPNLYASAAGTFAPTRLTNLNPQVAQLIFGEQRVVRWKSKQDGEQIEGVLTLPPGYQPGRRVPLLLIIHGGPSGVSANTFNPGGRYPAQVFAGMGYASLQPNYRGSTGYGERFRGLNRGHISGHDWIDVNSGVDYLIGEGIADPERLGIMGWSFGGHHTFWGITQTNRFKAASAGAGANDLISMYSQTDLPGFYHTYLGPRPWENFELYEQRSAYRFVDRVTTPLLIQVGERDERVPAEQSIQFYEAVSGLGKAPAKLVIYPGEGHGLREVNHIRDMMMRNIEWFSRWIPLSGAATDGGRD
jgi:dipeptidyl aminopeptidase/acylaminoacyl peptidase